MITLDEPPGNASVTLMTVDTTTSPSGDADTVDVADIVAPLDIEGVLVLELDLQAATVVELDGVKLGVGEFEGVFRPEPVGDGVPVSDPVGVGVPVGDAVCEPDFVDVVLGVFELLDVFDGDLLGLAPSESDAVGDGVLEPVSDGVEVGV